MPEPLSTHQLRVLGVLVEKQLSTPEYYPLTRNALLAGCNQKSNRDPVMQLGETPVVDALADLRRLDLAREIHDPSGRVPRYAHRINAVYDLDGEQAAVVCELILRGPQTAGEIRNRSARLTQFDSVEKVESILNELAERESPLAVLLERRPGARERRWAHLLGVAPRQAAPEPSPAAAAPEPVASADHQPADAPESLSRIEALEAEVVQLRAELEELRADYRQFKSQLE
jgi:uncharacterized protein YceH (UPF0502 family)